MTASKSSESSLEAILAVRRIEYKVEKDKERVNRWRTMAKVRQDATRCNLCGGGRCC
jgi:hypothetical protein